MAAMEFSGHLTRECSLVTLARMLFVLIVCFRSTMDIVITMILVSLKWLRGIRLVNGASYLSRKRKEVYI